MKFFLSPKVGLCTLRFFKTLGSNFDVIGTIHNTVRLDFTSILQVSNLAIPTTLLEKLKNDTIPGLS